MVGLGSFWREPARVKLEEKEGAAGFLGRIVIGWQVSKCSFQVGKIRKVWRLRQGSTRGGFFRNQCEMMFCGLRDSALVPCST